MTEQQQKLLTLAKQNEELRKTSKELDEEIATLLTEIGLGTMFQDPETGAVYKVVKPKGTFTAFRDIGYDRTVLPGEERGTLSKKEAEAAGFVLKK